MAADMRGEARERAEPGASGSRLVIIHHNDHPALAPAAPQPQPPARRREPERLASAMRLDFPRTRSRLVARPAASPEVAEVMTWVWILAVLAEIESSDPGCCSGVVSSLWHGR
jgi:hypothetical protein